MKILLIILVISLIVALLLNFSFFNYLQRKIKAQEEADKQVIAENAKREQELEHNNQRLLQIKNDIQLAKESYDEIICELKNEYHNKKTELEDDLTVVTNEIITEYNNQIKNVRHDYNKIKSVIDAATESLRLQQAEEEKKQFYMLQVKDTDKADFIKLAGWKEQLSSPRILSMLLWQTYIQKPLKILSAKVLGDKTIIGIYKITYIPTGECYIGQSVDVTKRWQEHCKCGCGVDTPPANKLYNAMQKYGIWNFSFELLEECKKEELNEKEATYIKLFDSVNNGYNSSSGNGKPMGV